MYVVPDDPSDDLSQAFALVVLVPLSPMQVCHILVERHDECDHCLED